MLSPEPARALLPLPRSVVAAAVQKVLLYMINIYTHFYIVRVFIDILYIFIRRIYGVYVRSIYSVYNIRSI